MSKTGKNPCLCGAEGLHLFFTYDKAMFVLVYKIPDYCNVLNNLSNIKSR